MIITLNEQDWDNFLKALNAPPKANEALKKLLQSKPLWEKS